MATIKKMNFYYSQTVQMRQFEPAVISLSAEVEVREGEDPIKAAEYAIARVKKVVDEEVKLKKIERKKNYDDEMELSR